MDDASLAHLDFLVAVAGAADAGCGFLDTGEVLHIAVLVDFEAIDLARSEVALDVPEMTAAAFGEEHIGSEFLVGEVVVPEEVYPNDMVTTVVGEANILAAVETHVFVDDGAHATLIVVVTVDIGDAFLDETLGFRHLLIGEGAAAVLPFDGKIDFPILMEGPTVIIVARNLGDFPFFDGFNVFLRACQRCKHHNTKCEEEFFHDHILLVFKLQKYSYFAIHANFFL